MTTDINLKAKYADIILKPRITEKANLIADKKIHTFEIAPSATKKQVAKAIQAFYKISPVKISITKNPSKSITVRGKKGRKPGVKKAVVYLKDGDKIE